MGYMHIDNLYKNVEILLFKECYAIEKIHGTSAHVNWKCESKEIVYFSGGEKHERFLNLFDSERLKEKFEEHFPDLSIQLFGEAYGGSQQGMSKTYGKELKFVVFDVKIGDTWLDVPNAEEVTKKMGMNFVSYNKVSTDLKSIDAQRDLPSVQAKRNGIEEIKIREGVVLRPLIEMVKSNGKRIIVKHKREEFLETKTKREVDPNRLKVLEDAKAIAEEWVTPMRLNHVLDKLGNPIEISETGKVIKAMIEDIRREAEREIKESKLAINYIGKETAKLYKNKISLI